MKEYIIGIDAGGTKVAYGLFDRAGNLLDRCQHPTDVQADGPALCDRMIGTVGALLEKNGLTLAQVHGVGVCMPSFIEFDKGLIHMTSAIVGVKNFFMRDYLQSRLGVQVVLDNDSNCAALAEFRRGAGRGARHMIYCAVSTGVGAGIIIDGQLFRGSYGCAGENGHMLATPDEGFLCGCGNRGCYMSHIAGRQLPDRMRARERQAGIESGECWNGERLLHAYGAGDPLAVAEMEHMAKQLGVLVFNMYQFLNINLYVFGGGLVNLGPALFDRAREVFDSYDHVKMPVEFRFAALKQDFGIIGASELLM